MMNLPVYRYLSENWDKNDRVRQEKFATMMKNLLLIPGLEKNMEFDRLKEALESIDEIQVEIKIHNEKEKCLSNEYQLIKDFEEQRDGGIVGVCLGMLSLASFLSRYRGKTGV